MLYVEIPVSDKEAQIMIVDITGKTITTRNIAPHSKEAVEFNVTSLASGMYVVKVNLDGATHIEKFIKN